MSFLYIRTAIRGFTPRAFSDLKTTNESNFLSRLDAISSISVAIRTAPKVDLPTNLHDLFTTLRFQHPLIQFVIRGGRDLVYR